MNNKNIFIAGAGGMLGKSLLKRLKDKGCNNLLTPSRKELNLLSAADVSEYFLSNKIDIVIFLAAKVGGIQANILDPVGYFYENMQMALNVIMTANKFNIDKLINIGSSCMYPRDRELLSECDLLSGNLEPTNEGYALSKLGAAYLTKYISFQFKRQYRTLIACNLYGPNDNFDPICSHMIPAAIHKIHQAKINKKPFVEIWGDGQARREFMFVDDFASSIIYFLDSDKDLNESTVLINVGLGHDYTVQEYYKAIAEVVGYSGEFRYDLNKPVGMRKKLLNSKIVNDLGWSSSYSLKQGLIKTYEFYKESIAEEITVE